MYFYPLVIFLLLLTVPPAHATPDGDVAQPMVYSVSKIIIDKKHPPTMEGNKELASPQQLMLDAEIKDALNFYRQDGWINLSAMQEGHAVLLVFQGFSQDPIVPVSNYAPIDILMVDEQGKITEIAPSLILANLEQDIYPQKPIKAFLLMASGSTTRLNIKPGDEVIYSIFKKPPPVISETSPDTAIPTPEIPARAVTKIPDANEIPQKPNFKERRKPEMQPEKSR